MQLKKNGTFGWTPLTYVVDIKEKKDAGPSFGLWAPGYFWIDDVAVVRGGPGRAADARAGPGARRSSRSRRRRALGRGPVRCPECGYRNMPAWGHCYACGTALEAGKVGRGAGRQAAAPRSRTRIPSSGGTVVAEHATEGRKALRLDKGYTVWIGPQDWSGYDYLKVDLFTAAERAASTCASKSATQPPATTGPA